MTAFERNYAPQNGGTVVLLGTRLASGNVAPVQKDQLEENGTRCSKLEKLLRPLTKDLKKSLSESVLMRVPALDAKSRQRLETFAVAVSYPSTNAEPMWQRW